MVAEILIEMQEAKFGMNCSVILKYNNEIYRRWIHEDFAFEIITKFYLQRTEQDNKIIYK
ncbi:MAG: hypothetical protein ACXVDV_20040 [Bacteroidia bacterium]